jgi:hypothetical protein
LWPNTSYPSMNALPNFTMEKHKFLKKLSIWTSEIQRVSVTYVNVQASVSAYRLDLEDRGRHKFESENVLQPSQSRLFVSKLTLKSLN